jgi:hypothetical protein
VAKLCLLAMTGSLFCLQRRVRLLAVWLWPCTLRLLRGKLIASLAESLRVEGAKPLAPQNSRSQAYDAAGQFWKRYLCWTATHASEMYAMAVERALDGSNPVHSWFWGSHVPMQDFVQQDLGFMNSVLIIDSGTSYRCVLALETGVWATVPTARWDEFTARHIYM